MIAEDELDFELGEREVELILFEVGDQVYGADAALVVRIDRPDEEAIARSDLGALKRGNRAIVFAGPGAKGALRVDAVRGVVTVPVDTLRKLPGAAVGKDSCAVGVWLNGEKPVLLVDLFATVKA